MTQASHRSKNLHVPLSEAVHRELRAVASRSGRPATALVREAVEGWLIAQRRAKLHDELADYAKKWAGTEVDLDPALEAAGAAELVRSSKTRRSRSSR